MASIKKEGLLSPIGVRKKGEKYEVVFGNRRLEAVRKLGIKTIDAIVLTGRQKEEDFLLTNLTENIQRQDISPWEYGRIISKLKNKFGLSNSEIAQRLGVSISRISVAESIYNKTPKEFRSDIANSSRVRAGKIPAGLAHQVLMMHKSNLINKPEVKRILTAIKMDKIVNRAHLIDIKERIEKGNTLSEAINKSGNTKTVMVRVNMTQNKYEEIVSKYGVKGLNQLAKEALVKGSPIFK